MQLAAIAMGLMVVAGPGWAGPDATTNRFLNDTVSMMDWGLLRIESFMEKRRKADITARYDWDSNRIVIEDVQIRDTLPDDVEAECKDWVKMVRVTAFVSPDTGELYGSSKISAIASLFSHNGVERTIAGRQDGDALLELDKVISARRYYMTLDEAGGYQQTFSCEGLLRSGDISVTRK